MRLVIDQPVEFRGLAVPGMTAEKEFTPLWAVQKLHGDFLDLPAVRFSIKRVPFPLVSGVSAFWLSKYRIISSKELAFKESALIFSTCTVGFQRLAASFFLIFKEGLCHSVLNPRLCRILIPFSMFSPAVSTPCESSPGATGIPNSMA